MLSAGLFIRGRSVPLLSEAAADAFSEGLEVWWEVGPGNNFRESCPPMGTDPNIQLGGGGPSQRLYSAQLQYYDPKSKVEFKIGDRYVWLYRDVNVQSFSLQIAGDKIDPLVDRAFIASHTSLPFGMQPTYRTYNYYLYAAAICLCLSALGCVTTVGRLVIRRGRQLRRLCLECGYDLKDAALCPECGEKRLNIR